MTAEASGGHLHGPDALQNSVAACLGSGPCYLSSSRGGKTGAPELALSPSMCAEGKRACGEGVQTSSRNLGRSGAGWSARILLHKLALRTHVHGVAVRCSRIQQTLFAWTHWIAMTPAAYCSQQVRCLVQHQP